MELELANPRTCSALSFTNSTTVYGSWLAVPACWKRSQRQEDPAAGGAQSPSARGTWWHPRQEDYVNRELLLSFITSLSTREV